MNAFSIDVVPVGSGCGNAAATVPHRGLCKLIVNRAALQDDS